MGEVAAWAICAAFWAGVAWSARRCRRIWRRDQLPWERRWEALSAALGAATIAAMLTLVAQTRFELPALTVLFSVVATLLGVGAVGCDLARRIALRRSLDQTRRIRADLGLPVERNLRSPWLMVGLWTGAGLLGAVGAVLVISSAVTALTKAESERIALIGMWAMGLCVAAGVLHGLLQYARIGREQRRVRGAEQLLLQAADSASP